MNLERFGADSPEQKGAEFLIKGLRGKGLQENVRGVVQTGSGQSEVFDKVMRNTDCDEPSSPFEVSFEDLDEAMGLPPIEANVGGHDYSAIIGPLDIQGADADINYATLKGRRHLYEGLDPKRLVIYLKLFKLLGASELWGANASGTVTPDTLPAPSLMLIHDHIDDARGTDNPFLGPKEEGVARFPDQGVIYTPETHELISKKAKELGLDLPSGVYIRSIGPVYETRTQVYLFRAQLRALWEEAGMQAGEDRFNGPIVGAVGMSSVNESAMAKALGYESIAYISAAANPAAMLVENGIRNGEVNHKDVKDGVAMTNEQLREILPAAILERQKRQTRHGMHAV